jgi:hypothetical protein
MSKAKKERCAEAWAGGVAAFGFLATDGLGGLVWVVKAAASRRTPKYVDNKVTGSGGALVFEGVGVLV